MGSRSGGLDKVGEKGTSKLRRDDGVSTTRINEGSGGGKRRKRVAESGIRKEKTWMVDQKGGWFQKIC